MSSNEALELEFTIDLIPELVDALEKAQVKHGKWIFRNIYGEDPYECSVCGNSVNVHGYPCCPNCGALMDAKEERNG